MVIDNSSPHNTLIPKIMTPHKPYLFYNNINYAHRVMDLVLLTALLLLLSPSLPSAGAQASPPDDNSNTHMNFSPNVGMIVIVLVAALFSMVFFSIYILHCSDAGSLGNSIRRIAGASMRGRPRGLDPEVIATFPTFVYSSVKGLKIGKGALECAVCLCEFEDDETLRLIPKCDHVFHLECIDEWLAAHTTCPVCRADLVPQPDESVHVPIGSVVNPDANTQTQVDDSSQNYGTNNNDNDNDNPISNRMEDSVKGGKEILIEGGGSVGRAQNRNHTRGSRRLRRFPRSHSTGHSLVQPGENIERFTLRLPKDVRKQLMNRAFSIRVPSMEESSRRGYRLEGEGSNRGGRSWKRLDRMIMSDRWVFNRMPSFLQRISSIRSPREPLGGEIRAESSHTSRMPV